MTSITGRSVIVVDDGLATGMTAIAAIQFLKQKGAHEIILSVPVSARDTADRLRPLVDHLICLEEPERFFAVGSWYQDFSQLTDTDINSILSEFMAPQPQSVRNYSLGISEEVTIEERGVQLSGHLDLPKECKGIVLFAHGSGSSRLSPRNQQVARFLQNHGIGTLLFDLLTESESENREHIFNIPLLSDRLLLATRWVNSQKWIDHLPIGFFGASTGAAAALWAAAELGNRISCVVSRGGRPDLAGDALGKVDVPTLLIVGSNDHVVIDLNKKALAKLAARAKELRLVAGATHLFEEPGTLEEVAMMAQQWFKQYLTTPEA